MNTFLPWGAIVAMVAAAVLVPVYGINMGWSDGVVGSFAGALMGAAATMFGAEFERRRSRKEDERQHDLDEKRRLQAAAERIHRIKSLVTTDLRVVATQHVVVIRALGRARAAARAGGGDQTVPLSRMNPLLPAFSSTLGAEVLLLEPEQLDALGTLQAGLSLTYKYVEHYRLGERKFAYAEATALQDMLNVDIGRLLLAFERLAPQELLRIPGADAEPAVIVLNRVKGETEEIELAPQPMPAL